MASVTAMSPVYWEGKDRMMPVPWSHSCCRCGFVVSQNFYSCLHLHWGSHCDWVWLSYFSCSFHCFHIYNNFGWTTGPLVPCSTRGVQRWREVFQGLNSPPSYVSGAGAGPPWQCQPTAEPAQCGCSLWANWGIPLCGMSPSTPWSCCWRAGDNVLSSPRHQPRNFTEIN